MKNEIIKETINKNSDGTWNKSTYDSNGNQLSYEDSYGNWDKSTYDKNGNELTYENSNGIKRNQS